VCLFFLVWALAIAGRLFWIGVVRHGEFEERAQKQQQRTFEVAPRRGVLYDRNLHELAMTVQVDSIYAVPRKSRTSRRPHGCWPPPCTPTRRQPDRGRPDCRAPGQEQQLAWVARRVTADVAARVKTLPLKGIYSRKSSSAFIR